MRHAGHFERHEQLGAETLRLRHGAARQFAAADAGGKPEIVLDLRTAARLSARGVPIEQQRPQSFRCAVHRRRETGRAGADDHQVVEIERRRRAIGRDARRPGAARGCAAPTRPRRTAPEARRADAGRVEQTLRVWIPRHVEPAIGDQIAGEKVLDRVRSRRPLVSNQPQSLRLGQILGLPGVEQVVDHREEALLRWIPRLREVVIEMRDVDGLDGGVDVRVGREQDAARQRIDLARLREHVGALNPGHPLVADHDRQRVAARLQLANGRERLFAGRRADDGVRLAIPPAQIAAHRRKHLRIVVNDQEDGLVHGCELTPFASAIGSDTRNSVRPGVDSTSISASLCLNQSSDDIEAQAGAFPDRLGSEERFEQAAADLGRNARAIVDDADDDALSFVGRRHVDATGFGDGVERVVDQVRPDLVELADEAANLWEVGRRR